MSPRVALLLLVALSACTGQGGSNQAQPLGTKPATTLLRDGLIAGAVKTKLIADLPDSTTTLGVHVDAGVVTLTGSVLSAQDRDRAVREASGVAGVTRVVDRLVVNPHAPRPREQAADLALQARIAAALTAQIGFNHVSIRVSRGVATLGGDVPDEKTKATAVATARGTGGIRNVVDRIRVERP